MQVTPSRRSVTAPTLAFGNRSPRLRPRHWSRVSSAGLKSGPTGFWTPKQTWANNPYMMSLCTTAVEPYR